MILSHSLWILSIIYFQLAEAKKSKVKRKIQPIFSDQTWQYIFITLAIIAILAILIFLLKKRQQLLRAQKLKSIKKALQVKQLYKKDKPCTMTQMQKDQAITWFSKQNWVLQQRITKQKFNEFKLKLKSIKRKTQDIDGQKLLKDYYDAFYVSMEGHGSVGSCDIFGVIMFQKFYMTFLFQKSFSNSKNSNGFYDYRFFDGSLKKGIFEGKWCTSNDQKISVQREAYKQNQKSNQEGASQKSFSKDLQQGLSPGLKKKQQRGTFKLYHK